MRKWKLRPYDNALEQELLSEDVGKLMARLLAQRNVDPKSVDSFVKCPYKQLSHPFDLVGVEKAAKLFCDVVLNKGTVGVMGDYDCDGVISSAMVKELCREVGVKCSVFIPSRVKHGYGLSEKAIESFLEKNRDAMPDLLFIVDCGTSNEAEVAYLKKAGIKHVVIVDHHIPDEEKVSKSADALINWHLCDHEEMCSTGEVYQLIRGIRCLTKKVDPINFLTYAALGTIADVSPVQGNNRIIVRNGLGAYALSHIMASGVNALMKTSKIDTDYLSQEDVGFRIAPRLNAAGRMFEADIAYGLLVEQETTVAAKIADYLESFNTDRKDAQKQIEVEANERVSKHGSEFEHGIMIYDEGWHLGILGIVSSKIMETFNKPTVILGKNGDQIKGSGRSMPGINLKEILDSCSELFLAHGGHAMAAGVSVKPEKIDEANKVFNAACKKYFDENDIVEIPKYYDAELKPSTISYDTAEKLKDGLYPYCNQTNPEPVFLLKDVNILSTSVYHGKGWSILSFFVDKDGEKVEFEFKMFTDEFGEEIGGQMADIYFKFPQSYVPNKYGRYQLNAVHIVVKK